MYQISSFKSRIIALGIFVILFSALTVLAAEFSSTNFQVLDPVIQPGGYSTSDSYKLNGVIGQISIGTSTATSFKLNSGFLFYPFVSTSSVRGLGSDGGVSLYWTPVTSALGWTVGGYNVGSSTASGGPYNYRSVGNQTFAYIFDLTNSATYYFVVRTEDAFGNSVATSSEISVAPTANNYRSIIGDLSISQASTTVIRNSNNTQLQIVLPADFLSSGESIHPEWYSASEDSVVSSKPLPSGKLAANTFYNISFFRSNNFATTSSLDKNATLTFTYTDDDISGIDESTLGAYRWDGSSWSLLSGSTVNTSANTVTVSSASFSPFALIGTAPASTPAPTPAASVVGGGGGGGGGGGAVATKVILQGRAFPAAVINIFKDGVVVPTPKADISGNFRADVGVGGGLYTFSIFAVDADNRRSLTSSFTTNVPVGFTVTLSDIVISPTIGADKSQVKQGNDIKFFGYAYPKSDIKLTINSEHLTVASTTSDSAGFWNYLLNSDILERGEHTAMSQLVTPDNLSSPFSESLSFRVGDQDIAAGKLSGLRAPTSPPGVINKNGDINNDKKVNLIDFSIMLFFWQQRNPSNPAADINQDGAVNLFDFSIMLFWWTG